MKDFWDLRRITFAPLSEAKAKLSALMRQLLTDGKRIVITNQGRPAAVLLSYRDYLALAGPLDIRGEAEERPMTLQQWRKGRKRRAQVVSSIAGLFEAKSLSRKGQKAYKEKALRDLDR